LLVIFLTVFIDLIGFGIVLPLVPRYGERFGAKGAWIGVIVGSFSVMQLVFAPWWGRWSDRIGRRPVLLISSAGSVISYGMFALAGWPGFSTKLALVLLFGSRVFAGACGANIAVASAYIADITPPESRAKGMALIGVAFGLGFVLGPALGAFSAARLGLAGPGIVAASLCAANLAFAWLALGESRRPGSAAAALQPRLMEWRQTLVYSEVGPLVGLYFLGTFCFATFETTLPLLLGSSRFHPDDFTKAANLAQRLAQGSDPASAHLRQRLSPAFLELVQEKDSLSTARLRRALYREFNQLLRMPALFSDPVRGRLQLRAETRRLLSRKPVGEAAMRLNRLLLEDAFPAEIAQHKLHYDEQRIGYLYAYCGLISVLFQGGLIGRLVKRFGERRLICLSLAAVGMGLAVMPFASGLIGLLASLALFTSGTAVNRAPTLGLLSLLAGAERQGVSLAVAQSAGTLARILGPVFAATLFAVSPHWPYYAGAGVALLGAALAWRFLCRTVALSRPGRYPSG
jgi:MFS family permease